MNEGRSRCAAGAAILAIGLFASIGEAATIGPPMLDITRQCGANTHHNVTAMSECVVAESEARSEILQEWNKVSDASAEKCTKASRKAKRFPYMAMAKCLSDEMPAPAAVPATDVKQ